MASDLGLIRSTLSEIGDWLDDDSVSEIMLNPSGFHFFERAGELLPLDVVIPYRWLCTTIEIIAHELGKECNDLNPLLDGRLADGSRIAAMLPPCSPDGPLLTIRKFPSKRLTLEDLIESGSLPVEVVALIQETLEGDENILISGGTSSGKTTTLNACASLLPEESRIVVIEDTKEIQITAPHCVRFEAKPKTEAARAVTIRDLLKATLRHRPDHIILGEIRSGEAYDLLQAMNTGHGGSMSTIHANSPLLALNRLESCVLQARVRLPIDAIRRQIADAIRLVVQVDRKLGRRRVTGVIRLLGCDDRSRYQTEQLYPEGQALAIAAGSTTTRLLLFPD